MGLVISFTLLRGIAALAIFFLYLVIGTNMFRYMCWRASGPRTRYLNPSDSENIEGFLAWSLAWPILFLCWHGLRAWYSRVYYWENRKKNESK